MQHKNIQALRQSLGLLAHGNEYLSTQMPSLNDFIYLDKAQAMSISSATLDCQVRPISYNKLQYQPAKVGESKFGKSYSRHVIRIQFQIPKQWLESKTNHQIHLLFNCSCQALILNYKGTQQLGGLNGGTRIGDKRAEEEHIISYVIKSDTKNDLQDQDLIAQKYLKSGNNNKIEYLIQISCCSMFGNTQTGQLLAPVDMNKEFLLRECCIARFNKLAFSVYWDVLTIRDCCTQLKNQQRKYQAYAVGHKILQLLDIDSLNDEVKLSKAQKLAKQFFSKKNSQSQHEVYAIGHCHIDSAWLWPFRQSRQKVARSWSSQIQLFKLDQFHSFNFCASSAQHYQWILDDHPNLFKKITKQISNGRFQPVGGTWVEFDGNIPSGQSMARQFLYGHQFFKNHFDFKSKVFFMPDTFGYSSQLPQIMREGGCQYFLTQKISWNFTNKFPHSTFFWKGIDGSQVLTHFPPASNYCSRGKLKDILKSQTDFQDKARSGDADKSLLLFGLGDGGGGPKREFIESLH